jgi:hypothetical protein
MRNRFEGLEITHIRKPVCVPETGSATWTGASVALIQTSGNSEVPQEPEIHGRGYGTSEGRVMIIFFGTLETTVPSGGHGHCIRSRTENEKVRFIKVRTDAGPMRTGRPAGAPCSTTRRIIYLGNRPASIRTQCFQPRAPGRQTNTKKSTK